MASVFPRMVSSRARGALYSSLRKRQLLSNPRPITSFAAKRAGFNPPFTLRMKGYG
jgi:hypothetical protein